GDEQGRADGQVQGYNLRLIMTYVEENRREVKPPEGYRREDFVGALQHFRSGAITKVFAPDRSGIYRAHEPHLPNGKTDVNDTPHALIRLSMPDINDAYPDGNWATRQDIIGQHYYYNVGLLYFLQNDPEVPETIQKDARKWALCQDEFIESGGLPPQLYIREARRMVGQHVFTGNDTQPVVGDARGRLHTDSIAIGDYAHNCHGTGRVGTRFDGKHMGEFYQNVPPYQIPYGVIVPQKTENLLVPVACSASHFGFGALRLEPIWTSLGQAAGWAAHLALERNVAVQAVPVQPLQTLLHRDKSATIYISDILPDSPEFSAVQWFGTYGGLHGLAPDEQPPPDRIAGQYTQAHPGHSVDWDKPLDPGLRERWQKWVPLAEPDTPKSRGEWILEAFESQELN
ncbi:MAG: FAD-dependent oxidoreductase, partial [Verrucomicrobiae bacterium]|nr:FAD-dependent oxidoreductase [Verrucomicrobiae bacterium]